MVVVLEVWQCCYDGALREEGGGRDDEAHVDGDWWLSRALVSMRVRVREGQSFLDSSASEVRCGRWGAVMEMDEREEVRMRGVRGRKKRR